MPSKLLLAACAAAALSFGAVSANAAVPANIAAAVADSGRPASDKALDAERKPGATLEFAYVKPGMTVVELIPGGGYFTRILSKAVGPKGVVYEVYPPPRPAQDASKPARTPAVEKIAAEPGYGNIKLVKASPAGFSLPTKADLVFTAQNYHDLHNIPNFDMAAFNKNVLNALKPGGLYVVIDHVAKPGDPAVTHTLHRIDPAVVMKEVTGAGFRYVGESEALRNPKDDHTKKVFDPAIRHHTDQFIYEFRKPG